MVKKETKSFDVKWAGKLVYLSISRNNYLIMRMYKFFICYLECDKPYFDCVSITSTVLELLDNYSR